MNTLYINVKYQSGFRVQTRWRILCLFIIVLLITQAGCKKLVNVPAPLASLNAANVYTTDATAIAVLTGIYTNMSNDNMGMSGIESMSLLPALSGDELTLYDINNINYAPYYLNELSNSNSNGTDYWSSIYPIIFLANSAIEGLNGSSNGLTPAVKQQLLGEAEFVRAFCYFYLVNIYGNIPLVLSTDYTTTALMTRTPAAQVWQQVISDLISAQGQLSSQYLDGTVLNTTNQRVRPTSWAATSLLARTYLYTGSFPAAEAQATTVINNSTLYSLDTLNGVFLANSTETIWSLQPTQTYPSSNTGEGALFILPSTGPNTSGTYPVYLSNHVLNAFEPGDLRRDDWVDSVTIGPVTYYYPNKYKQGAGTSSTFEYPIQLRLAEQYLIRAEARAQQGKTAGALSDLDTIRNRASLSDYAGATDLNSLEEAILHERRVELFTEWGHRWFDLKRTATIDSVMGSPGNICQQKSGQAWNPDWQWYPIPLSELELDPNLAQNVGY